ncbi:hypothetical protein HYR99_15925, partial [Candidatus Poribacteria bacterium]|nr:hypothetical protein [Candidatus Poribacteria bacterium]
MKRFYWILASFSVLSLAILGGIALRNGDEAIPSENTHPLVQGVRIIPAPVTESTNS